MLTLLNLILASSLAISPQVRNGDRAKGILYTSTNAKYHLVCEFYGDRIATPRGTPQDNIIKVVIRNEQTGEAVTYNPPKSGSETMPDYPDFSNHDVWSPDGEWLVLSIGSQAGYQLIRASDALAELKQPRPKEFLVLTGRKFKDGLYHQFLGWQSPASFFINVTGDLHTTSVYHFYLETFRLNPLFDGEGIADTYITSEGKHAVRVDPMITTPHRK